MPHLQLSIGISDYDHVRDLTSGVVRAEGLLLTHLDLPVEEIFYRFLHHREWDISEISFAKYCALVASGDTSLVGIPVFPSRAFRHSSIYVRADSGLTDPRQLRGKVIGLPEWAQTAAVYSRALLQYEYDVNLSDVTWVQAGVNEAGRKEKVAVALPPGVSCTSRPDTSLSAMLLTGEVDAVFSAHPPACHETGDGVVVRLVRDLRTVEQDYAARTGIFPIMHTVVIRREVVDTNPWVPMSLFKGFEVAKQRSLARLRDVTISRYPIPMTSLVDVAGPHLGDIWPYGIEPNLATIDAFLTYAHEQGVIQRELSPEELFSPAVDAGFRI